MSLVKLFGPLAGCCLLLLLSLSLRGSAGVKKPGAIPPRHPDLVEILNNSRRTFTSGNTEEALRSLQRGLMIAQARKAPYEIAAFQMAIGTCYLLTHRYRKAIAAYEAGSEIAGIRGYDDLALGLATNRASVYRMLSDYTSALEALRSVQHLIGPGSAPGVLMQAGTVMARKGDLDQGSSLFRYAADMADKRGDPATQALAWNQLGYLYLEAGRLAEADECLTRGFRLRKMFAPRELSSSYVYLGLLRLAQKDPQSALHLLDQAISAGMSRSQIAPPYLYYDRGQAKAAAGYLQDALADYEQAIRLAREWRLEVLPADAFRISAESSLQGIYSHYIDTGMQAYAKTRNREIARRVFEVSEENRALSMRQGLNSRADYPDEYWAKLDQLRTAIVNSASRKEARLEAHAAELRLQLTELEVRHGLLADEARDANATSAQTIAALQARLRSSEALIRFDCGPKQSYAWAITREGWEAAAIPNSRELSEKVAQFRNALRGSDRTLSRRVSRELYKGLFGVIEKLVRLKPHWLLSLDGPLWELPFAALTEDSDANGFLTEKRSLRTLPAAALLGQVRESIAATGGFVGVGDSIYNAADARFPSTSPRSGMRLQMARLPGSRKEIEEGARAWDASAPAVLLSGEHTTRPEIEAALNGTPAVLHLATHVVQHPSAKEQVMIALGLRPSGEAEFLLPANIASWRHRLGLVVLSGCGSGNGPALPGTGLLGLTRAWLLSGAQAVLATYWPIPDDVTPFFQIFYRKLRAQTGGSISSAETASALQAAQKAMLASGDWRSDPSYWGSFFIVGRD